MSETVTLPFLKKPIKKKTLIIAGGAALVLLVIYLVTRKSGDSQSSATAAGGLDEIAPLPVSGGGGGGVFTPAPLDPLPPLPIESFAPVSVGYTNFPEAAGVAVEGNYGGDFFPSDVAAYVSEFFPRDVATPEAKGKATLTANVRSGPALVSPLVRISDDVKSKAGAVLRTNPAFVAPDTGRNDKIEAVISSRVTSVSAPAPVSPPPAKSKSGLSQLTPAPNPPKTMAPPPPPKKSAVRVGMI